MAKQFQCHKKDEYDSQSSFDLNLMCLKSKIEFKCTVYFAIFSWIIELKQKVEEKLHDISLCVHLKADIGRGLCDFQN